MTTYFELKDKKKCNGCGVCALRCPKEAIVMKEDEEGFLYPEVDFKKCIKCNLCKKICPNHEYDQNQNIKTYMAVNNNEIERKNSSSGGIYYILSKYIIEKKGIVFGVKYDKELIVCHDYADNLEEIKKFQGSKYVRSDLRNSYKDVEKFLKEDRYVLFTGTPCQCQGLRSFLGKEYNKLITCDIICHANPSPKVFELYKQNIEKKYNSKIKNIIFRDKNKYGWHSGSHTTVVLENGNIYDIPEYCNSFLNELINRPSCHSCYFCSENRLSDFTIGDMWGIEKIDPKMKDDNTGISLLSVNSNKAQNIFKEIKNNFYFKEIPQKIAFKYNHHENVSIHKNRNKFFTGIVNGKINNNNVIYYMNKLTKKPIYIRVIKKIKSIIKKIINYK